MRRITVVLALALAACGGRSHRNKIEIPPAAPPEAWRGVVSVAVMPPDCWTSDIDLEFVAWYRGLINEMLRERGWSAVPCVAVNRGLNKLRFTMAGELGQLSPTATATHFGCDAMLYWSILNSSGTVELAFELVKGDGTRLWVSGETAGDVTVIDVAARTILERVVHGGGDAMGLALTADGRTLYAAAGENRVVLKLDTATHKVTAQIPVPGVVHEATLTLDGRFLYTTLRKANRVVVVSTADDRVVATLQQKGYPDLVVMAPGGRHAFVTNRTADLVAVIDVGTHQQVKTIPVGRAPHGLALRPR